MSPELAATIADLRPLAMGDRVLLTVDGRQRPAYVSTCWRVDPGGGSVEHGKITVGYGPGRWNVEVSAVALVEGTYHLDPDLVEHRCCKCLEPITRGEDGIWRDDLRVDQAVCFKSIDYRHDPNPPARILRST